jgi:hypothetical protein
MERRLLAGLGTLNLRILVLSGTILGVVAEDASENTMPLSMVANQALTNDIRKQHAVGVG